MAKLTMQEAALIIQKRLAKAGVAIHRYDAITSNSIYLKFDYGIAYSLRISDHRGYKHLKYRYNLVEDAKEYKRKVRDKNVDRYYYSMDAIETLITDILEERKLRMMKEGAMYDHKVKQQISYAERGTSRFWSGAHIIAPYTLTTSELSEATRYNSLMWGVPYDTGREER